MYPTGDDEETIVLMHAAICGDPDILRIVLDKIREVEANDAEKIKVSKVEVGSLAYTCGQHSAPPEIIVNQMESENVR